MAACSWRTHVFFSRLSRKNETGRTDGKQVIDVVGEQLDKKGAVTVDSNFIEDLDADSLDTVELIMKLEEKFGVSTSSTAEQREPKLRVKCVLCKTTLFLGFVKFSRLTENEEGLLQLR